MPPPPPPADSLADDAAFLAEATGQEQIDLEQVIAAKAAEDDAFIGKCIADFQTAALNATEAEEVDDLFEELEESTDGRLSVAARQQAEAIRSENVDRLTK